MPLPVIIIGGFILVLALYAGARLAIAGASAQPPTVGQPGQLAPCPASPNCVSSLTDPSDRLHYIDAIPYTGSTDDAQDRLRDVLKGMERMMPVNEVPGYVHVIFRSSLWGFVDDVEFVFDEANSLIQVRSAARLGYSDIGVNRQRVKAISSAFNP